MQAVGAELYDLAAPSATSASTSLGVWLTFLAAVIAALVAGGSIYYVRKTGSETTENGEKMAKAAQDSADAAQISARAAEGAVAINQATALAQGVRAEADARAKLYQDAANQLGHEHAAVRIVGVYGMARLADDWPEQRQNCVDILCAYLRMSPGQGESDLSQELETRAMLVSVIVSHLRGTKTHTSWEDLTFDFSGAHLSRADFSHVSFRTKPDFSRAVFAGICLFDRASFHGGFDLSEIVVGPDAVLSFEGVSISSGPADFTQAQFQPGSATLVRLNEMAGVSFQADRIQVDGLLIIEVERKETFQGMVSIPEAAIGAAGRLRIVRRPQQFPTDSGYYPTPIISLAAADAGAEIFVDEALEPKVSMADELVDSVKLTVAAPSTFAASNRALTRWWLLAGNR